MVARKPPFSLTLSERISRVFSLSLSQCCLSKGLCNNYLEGGGGGGGGGGGAAEKLELSSKNLDRTPLQNKNNWF